MVSPFFFAQLALRGFPDFLIKTNLNPEFLKFAPLQLRTINHIFLTVKTSSTILLSIVLVYFLYEF